MMRSKTRHGCMGALATPCTAESIRIIDGRVARTGQEENQIQNKKINPKFQSLNPKQIQSTKFKTKKAHPSSDPSTGSGLTARARLDKTKPPASFLTVAAL